MFAKALVITTATALKLQATVELSTLAGVNIKALSREELAQLKAGTRQAYNEYKEQFGKSHLTEAEDDARQEQWLDTRSKAEQAMQEDPQYEANGNVFDDMTEDEVAPYKGTRGLEAAPENERSPVENMPFDEETQLLARAEDTWNCVYPGDVYTYQYVHDSAVNANPSWGCNAFFTWDEHWLEQVGYRAYYDYYVTPGYCSDEYLRSWWNANIISWREYLADYIQCTDDSQ